MIHDHAGDESLHCTGPIAQIREGGAKLVPWLMASCILSGLALSCSMFGFYEFTRAEREFRLLQNQQQMTNAWLARMGAVSPMDVYQGPEGNFFFKPPPQKGK